MINVFLELQRLKSFLLSKGLHEEIVESIVREAQDEISLELSRVLDNALEQAVEAGVEKRSIEFINEIRPRPDAFILETESNTTNFSRPPKPMLDALLSNAKPKKDGTGVYKVIPVGGEPKTPRQPMYASIFDAQKAEIVKRKEAAIAASRARAPKGSVVFRTASSSQDRSTQWVLPAKEADFTDILSNINSNLQLERDNIVMSIIRKYEDMY